MRSRLHAQSGFTLVEVLVASTVLLIGVLGTLTLADAANRVTVKTRARDGATNLVRELIEASRAIPYAALVDTGLEAQLQAAAGGVVDESLEPGWQVRRRGRLYTVDATVCSMDDARDGGGARDAGSFCTDSVAANTPDPRTGAPDRTPEDYKRVSVTASTATGGRMTMVRQAGVISNPGSAAGPAVTALTLGGSAAPPQVTSATSLSFAIATSSSPAALRWTVDGATQGTLSAGTGLAWSVPWALGGADDAGGTVDGVYVVGVEAIDRYGVAGASRAITVSLNRSLPDQITGLAGGRNTVGGQEVVELEWLAGRERDIIGYRVFAVQTNGLRAVCDLQLATTCTDTAQGASASLQYVVIAYDRDPSGAERGGPQSLPLVVGSVAAAPGPPTALTAARAADGSVTLRWTKPAAAGGAALDFYRVYRDGNAIDDRYARWDDDATSVTFVDGGAADGNTHTYWVSSVHAGYVESTLAGPVSG